MNIGVVFGSRSPEHDVSIITGQLIISTLKKEGFSVSPIYIDKSGIWHISDRLGELKFFKNLTPEKLKPFSGWSVNLEAKNQLTLEKGNIFKKQIKLDLVFPALHGANGEDGTIQGLCELLSVPYVGCSVPASAITMDKVLTKDLLIKYNLPTPKYTSLTKSDFSEGTAKKRLSDLNYPLFVKPAHLGSSIGITKTKNESEVLNAIEVAFHYDSKILIEEGIEPTRDLTCAVLGGDDKSIITSLVQESDFDSDLFSYEDKYLKDGGAQTGQAKDRLHIPADLPNNITNQIKNLAREVFTMFELSGNCRIDFLYNNQDVFINEINTIPGTMYHHLWEKSDLKLPDLLNRLIDIAKFRHQNKASLANTFNSSILDHAHSAKLNLPND